MNVYACMALRLFSRSFHCVRELAGLQSQCLTMFRMIHALDEAHHKPELVKAADAACVRWAIYKVQRSSRKSSATVTAAHALVGKSAKYCSAGTLFRGSLRGGCGRVVMVMPVPVPAPVRVHLLVRVHACG